MLSNVNLSDNKILASLKTLFFIPSQFQVSDEKDLQRASATRAGLSELASLNPRQASQLSPGQL